MAIEIGGRVELSMAKVDAKGVMMPIVETKDEYLIISSEKQFEEASKRVYIMQLSSFRIILNLDLRMPIDY